MDLKQLMSSFSANPKQVLKIVLLFSVVMLAIWLLMVSQMDTGKAMEINSPDANTQARADSIRSVLSASDQGRYNDERSSNLFMNAFTTFFVLTSIMGGVWFWSRKKPQNTTAKQFNELGTQLLGQNAQLKIIEINNEVWVIAVTANSVDLLHRYNKKDWITKEERSVQEGKNSFLKILRGQQ